MGLTRLLAIAVAGLSVLILAATVLPPPWSWSIGLAYILYDTWLLWSNFRASRLAAVTWLRAEPAVPDRSQAVVIAAHNERLALPATLAALRAAGAGRVVVVDDGSDDGTVDLLALDFSLTKVADDRWDGGWLTVLRQARAGKAAALNLALDRLGDETEVVVTIDADTAIAPESLAAMHGAFRADPQLIAACGVLDPRCAPGLWSGYFRIFQHHEYARAFLWRAGWSAQGSLVLVSGAFAAYRCQALRTVGGFDPASRVEDYEVMFRLHRAHPGMHALVIPEARAVTEAPGSPLRFLRQRQRWFAGFLLTMLRHRRMVGDPSLGRLGTTHLRLKTVDMVLPIYGLAAGIVLIVILLRHGSLDPLVVTALVAKAVVDAAIHAWSRMVCSRWLGQPAGWRGAVAAVGISLAEQVAFQPLRQLAAALGWIAVLRRSTGWRPTR